MSFSKKRRRRRGGKGVACAGKWVTVAAPATPVGRVAVRILDRRLRAVARLLPLAAFHHREDVEHVHRLRVSCRRAGAAVRAFEPLLVEGKSKLRRWLHRIRRAAGPARDADVLLERWQPLLAAEGGLGERVLQRLCDERESAQSAIVDAARRAVADGRLVRCIDTALAGVRVDDGRLAKQPFHEYAEHVLHAFAAESFDLDPAAASLTRLHQLRIDAKRLRYAIEIFHSGLPEMVRRHDYPVIQEIQSRLGLINDHIAAQRRCQAWLGSLPPEELAAFLAERLVREHRSAQQQRAAFLSWWDEVEHELFGLRSDVGR